MMKAFRGVYLIRADIDDWGVRKLRRAGFEFDGIPVFFKLDADGNPTGEVIDPRAWGRNIPSKMAPVLDKFFHNSE